MNNVRSILYKLNEGNANNPANLQVGESIQVNHYTGSNIDNSFTGVIESINSSEIIVRDYHTFNNYNFIFNGFNAHENGIEFINIDDSNLRFYIYN